jgi:hypothetical protein
MILRWNGNLISVNGKLADCTPAPPPVVPSDMDFIYLADKFDGTKVVNSAPNSTFGDYMAQGTITKNGSGALCYLTNNNTNSNYLYKWLTETEKTNIEAVTGTYTYFIRMINTTSVGGIVSTRAYNIVSGDHYNYMVRCSGKQIEFHDTTGHLMSSADFPLDVDRVYKLQISGSYFYLKNLDTAATYAYSYSTSRNMSNYMTTFWAGFMSEAHLDRFYGFAGIARTTTESEDTDIKNCLMNQQV